MRTALVAGGTGLVGKTLLDLLSSDDTYTAVRAITRRPLADTHPRIVNTVVDFERLNEFSDILAADDVFCCLGTTMKKAGTKEAFRTVDYAYPLMLAQIAREKGASKFMLVSALGSNPNSMIFYSRVKGELEKAVAAIDFKAIHIFRPSFLSGQRDENRPGEKFAIALTGLFGFVTPARYKSIDAPRVALAMLKAAKSDALGVHIHESDEMQGA